MSTGRSRSSLESDVRSELRRLSNKLDDDDIQAISKAVATAINKNNRDLENEIHKLRQEIYSRR